MKATARRAAGVWLAGLAAAVLAACGPAVVPRLVATSPEAWARALRGRAIDLAAAPNPIRFDEEMRRAAIELAGPGGRKEQLESLQRALFDPAAFPFRYEARTSLTAEDAFRARRGNCLAFTNLFIALARSLGIEVEAAIPAYAGTSELEGDLVVVNSHVVAAFRISDNVILYDFDRSRDRPIVGARMVDDLFLAGLYANNQGVAALREGRIGEAIERFGVAVRLAPAFAAAHGNLGVARRRAGDTAGALEAYRAALSIEPRDPSVLGNLATLYRAQGNEREAEAALRLADPSSASPYLLVVLGDLALAQGRPQDALRHYRRARRLDRSLADAGLGTARAEAALGHRQAARRVLEELLASEPGLEEARRLHEELAR